VVAYDLPGGTWLLLPLAWSIERFSNGLRPATPLLTTEIVAPALAIGLAAAIFLSLYIPNVRLPRNGRCSGLYMIFVSRARTH
jgi:hypothetical protein